jgi:putative DNA primase/helicase
VKVYQRRRPTDAELRVWVGRYPGLGIVGGKVSGKDGAALEILDIEAVAKASIKLFCQLVEEVAPGLLDRLPRVKTPTGGCHIYYRCKIVEGNQKLAQRAEEVTAGDLPRTNDGAVDKDAVKKLGLREIDGRYFRIRTLIETRGEGGQVLSPLCLPGTHPNDGVYELRNGDLRDIPTITTDQREMLLNAARACNEFVEPAKAKGAREAEREKIEGLKPGADYNSRSDAFEKSRALLDEFGWTLFISKSTRSDSLGELWSRPGVNDHCSARLFNSGALHVFTSNADRFTIGETYSPFAIYSELKHGGDYSAAAKALAAEGYGERRKSSKIETDSKSDQPQADSQGKTETEAAEKTKPVVVVAHYHVLDSILEKVVEINFPKLFEDSKLLEKVNAIKQKHYLVASIEELLKLVKVQNYQLARKNDFVFAFNGEYWREIDRDALKDFLMAVAQKQGVAPFEAKHYEFRDKLYKQFIALAGFRTPEPDTDKVLINLLNGTFEISAEKQDIREFRAVDFLTHQLPFKYDKDATAPKFEAYLKRVLPEQELRDIVAEFFGYVFTKNLKLEKALLLYGGGANGKSVLFDIMNALLGKENTANFSLSDLIEEHNRAQIAHKLLNYGSEINASITKDVFKNLVSGEPIMARMKYGNPFLMERYAKLCFNCNELPKDIEQSDAYFRRLLIVPFRLTLPESEWVVDLARQIIREELAGVFNWVLDGLKRLLNQKKFTNSQIVREMIAEYKRESDSVACFLRDENWGPDPHNPEHTETLKKVHMAYQSYCREAGHKPLGRNNFKKRLTANKIVEATKAGCSQEFYIACLTLKPEKKCFSKDQKDQKDQNYPNRSEVSEVSEVLEKHFFSESAATNDSDWGEAGEEEGEWVG